jgi:hypothetical protein
VPIQEHHATKVEQPGDQMLLRGGGTTLGA